MMEGKDDLFDRMMRLPGLRIFGPFYRRHREVLLYLFFGGIAFFLNFFLFLWLDTVLSVNELLNNMICWIICVLFQYVTNRTWVFPGETKDGIPRQLAAFLGGRVFTLVVEEIILLVFVLWLNFGAAPVKFAAQIVVIVLNYIISKYLVFK